MGQFRDIQGTLSFEFLTAKAVLSQSAKSLTLYFQSGQLNGETRSLTNIPLCGVAEDAIEHSCNEGIASSDSATYQHNDC